MLDVRELMSEHARDLVVVEHTHQSRRDRNCRIRRVSSRRKRVWRILIDDVDARHRKPRTSREFLHEAVELGCTLTVNLLRIIHAEHHAVGEPV